MTSPEYSTPPRGMSDLKSLPPFDLGVLVTGVLAFIVSFFPWYGAKVSGATVDGFHVGGASRSENAWHSYSTLALLLILAATGIAGAAIFARFSLPASPVGVRWIAAGVSSLGALLYLIRVLTVPRHAGSEFGVKVSEGIRWGGWLLLLIVLANAAATVISALSSDEPVPWAGRIGTAPPPASSAT